MNEEFKPDKMNFIQICMNEINNKEINLNEIEKKFLRVKLLNLYDEGWWNSEADITIQSDIYHFIKGFNCYKKNKRKLGE